MCVGEHHKKTTHNLNIRFFAQQISEKKRKSELLIKLYAYARKSMRHTIKEKKRVKE